MNSDSEWERHPRIKSKEEFKDPRVPMIIEDALYYQDSDHWYEDGNIILIARNTAFRLFKSIIIKRSPAMKDMLGLPQSVTINRARESLTNEQLSFEGVPVVKLDDIPHYFRLLLDAILPRDSTNHPISEDLRVGSLLGVARIAKMYQVDDVVARVGNVLENMLPTKEHPDGGRYEGNGNFGRTRSVHIINWARFCGLPQFLPLPFYYLAVEEWKDATSESVKTFQRLSTQDQLRIYRAESSYRL